MPDSCQSKIDLMFVIDMSGSIRSSGYALEKQFARDVANYFDIGLDATRVALISYSSNSRIDFDFNDYTTKADLLAKIMSVGYGGGGTSTDKALNDATAMFQNTIRGARSLSEGVPKICVLLTDGGSNNAGATIQAGQRLKDSNVNVFSIGAGNVRESELIAVASEPKVDHFYRLAQVKDIPKLIKKMATFSCNEAAVVTADTSIDVNIEQGDYRYFKPKPREAGLVTKTLLVDIEDLEGASHVFVSSQDKNPGPYANQWQDVSGTRSKLIAVERNAADEPLYIGIKGSSQLAAQVELEIYNDLFPALHNESELTFDVHEHFPLGIVVFTPPPLGFLPEIGTISTVTYSLSESGVNNSHHSLGNGQGSNDTNTFPFEIDPNTGTIVTTRELEYSTQQEWTLDVLAKATAPRYPLVKGLIRIVVLVTPDSTTPTSTLTTTQTTTPTTTQTTTPTTSATSTPTTTAIPLGKMTCAGKTFDPTGCTKNDRNATCSLMPQKCMLTCLHPLCLCNGEPDPSHCFYFHSNATCTLVPNQCPVLCGACAPLAASTTDDDDGLSAGSIIGIIMLILLVCCICCIVVWLALGSGMSNAAGDKDRAVENPMYTSSDESGHRDDQGNIDTNAAFGLVEHEDVAGTTAIPADDAATANVHHGGDREGSISNPTYSSTLPDADVEVEQFEGFNALNQSLAL